jgi:hypothetical protein
MQKGYDFFVGMVEFWIRGIAVELIRCITSQSFLILELLVRSGNIKRSEMIG